MQLAMSQTNRRVGLHLERDLGKLVTCRIKVAQTNPAGGGFQMEFIQWLQRVAGKVHNFGILEIENRDHYKPVG